MNKLFKEDIKVVHVSPTWFSEKSLIGGGERYVSELAAKMSNRVDTTLVSFGKRRESLRKNSLKIEIYPAKYLNVLGLTGGILNPFSLGFLKELKSADIIHCHQFYVDIARISTLYAKAFGKKVIVTDYGFRCLNFARFFKFGQFVNSFLLLTPFSSSQYEKFGRKIYYIYGGIDTNKFTPHHEITRKPKVVFVGRIMPHKGINYLIGAVNNNLELVIIGKGDENYINYLKEISNKKNVTFLLTDNSDDIIIGHICSAAVLVLPSVYKSVFGRYYPEPELFGLVLAEAMACETPVICTEVGGMPYVVDDGVNGFIVPPNDSNALREKIRYFIKNPSIARKMGKAGREKVLECFTWDKVAKRCLNAYKSLLLG